MALPLLPQIKLAIRKRAVKKADPDVRRVFSRNVSAAKDNPGLPQLSAEQLAQWQESGFVVLKSFFDQATVQSYTDHVDGLWRERARADNPLVIYSMRGGHHFRDAIDEDRSQTYRLLDQYLTDPRTRDLCMQPRLMQILQQLMGHRPVVCNSILFEWGSEQDMHSDMFYMPPLTENQMLATWIALDDVTEDNGPLVYVPKSHKMAPFRFSNGRIGAITEEVEGAVQVIQKQMDDLGLRPETFLANKGDVLIWHSQLVHGGAPIQDPTKKRASLVTHYYSTCDVPNGGWLCAERHDGSLFLMKTHVSLS